MPNTNLLAAGATVQSILEGFLETVINPLIPILIGLALLTFFYGLYKYLKSGMGDTEDIKGARSLMLWGVIIIFVMFSVWGFVNILQGIFFGADDVSQISADDIPTFR